MQQRIQAGKFKAECLRLMDVVQEKKCEYIITKRDHPVAKLIPIYKTEPKSLFGKMKGTGKIVGDLISPIDEEWNAGS